MKSDFSKNLSLLIASTMLSLLLGEIFIRIALPQQLIRINDDIWIADTLLGWRPKPDVNTLVNTGDRTVRYVSDREGRRINPPPEETYPPDPDLNLLALGDSFLHGFEVENRETIPQVLAGMLREKHGVKLKAVNGGVRGYNPGQYYLMAKDALKDEKYDLGIVFLWVGDDIYPGIDTTFAPHNIATIHRFGIPHSLNWSEFREKIFYPVNDFLERHSHLFLFLKIRSENLLAKIGLTAKTYPDVFYLGEANSSRWEDTAETCRFIYEEFARCGTPVFFVLLPTEFQVYQEIFYDYIEWFDIPLDSVDLEMPSRLLSAAFEKKGLKLVNSLPLLRQSAAGGAKLFCEIDIHLNRAGLYAVSELILPVVEEYLCFLPPPSEN